MIEDMWIELADFYRKVAAYEHSKGRESSYEKLQRWAERREKIAENPLKSWLYIPWLGFEYIIYKIKVKPTIEDMIKKNL